MSTKVCVLLCVEVSVARFRTEKVRLGLVPQVL